jgi:hypothetical protein
MAAGRQGRGRWWWGRRVGGQVCVCVCVCVCVQHCLNKQENSYEDVRFRKLWRTHRRTHRRTHKFFVYSTDSKKKSSEGAGRNEVSQGGGYSQMPGFSNLASGILSFICIFTCYMYMLIQQFSSGHTSQKFPIEFRV